MTSLRDEEVALVERDELQTVIQTEERVVRIVEAEQSVAVVDAQVAVLLERAELVTVSVGEQGPAGPTGPIGPAGGSAMTVTAGAALSGHRVVYLDAAEKAQYASNQTASHALITLGMTLSAAALDAPVSVQRSGEVTEPSWSWTLEQPVYLDDSGLLTQTPPASPALFQRIVGFPTAATKLFLALREPVFIL